MAQIQLQAILNNIVGGVALVEFADTPKPIYLNPGFFKYFEYDSRGSGRFDFFYRVHPDDIDFVKSAAYNAIRSGLPLSLQCRINVRREVRWINIQGVRIDYEDSIYPVAVVIVSDISELKEIEANFQSTSLELSTILDNIPGGVAIFELAGNRILSLYNNEALLAFSGYTDEEYKKVAADTVEFFIYNEDRPYVFESVKKCLESTSDSLSLTFRVKHQTEGFRFKNHFYDWYHLYGHVHSSFEYNMMEHDKFLMQELYGHKCQMYNIGAMMPWMDYTPRTLDEILTLNTERVDKNEAM